MASIGNARNALIKAAEQNVSIRITTVDDSSSDSSFIIGQGETTLWPLSGRLVFENVSLVYRPGLPRAVNDVSFIIENSSHVGIVGRTGSGKTSLTLLAFRIMDPTEGRILFDGRDIMSLGIMCLRKAFAIVPQHPILFHGTIRNNLDPFQEFDDEMLVNALKAVFYGLDKLKSDLDALQFLDTHVGSDASVLSSGEKQLLSLARALLRPVHVIIADEASSSLDEKTDNALQAVLRKHFKDTTTLTVAHRLNSVIRSDKILVMDKGRVAEYGTPSSLLDQKNSRLRHIAMALGDQGFQTLRRDAN
jgi:ABC-type multidrug transport system fused ATPase/permease subunit